MIRNCSLADISDGKLYGENDMVKCDTKDCAGCNAGCCRGMGESIVLDPYDVYRLTKHLKLGFEQLLDGKLEIGAVDGVLLPHIRMAENDACSFLDGEGRCSVHAKRPGICRLFPLGRFWESDTSFKYILQTGECTKNNLTKIKVKKWLATENITEYNDYIVMWHKYVKKIQTAVSICMSGEDKSLAATQVKTICMYTLKMFFMTPFDEETDFFSQFEERVNNAVTALGLE